MEADVGEQPVRHDRMQDKHGHAVTAHQIRRQHKIPGQHDARRQHDHNDDKQLFGELVNCTTSYENGRRAFIPSHRAGEADKVVEEI